MAFTSVETQYKEIQVKTQSQTICHGNLLIELVKFKLTSRLVFIIPYCPDIPGIYKEGSSEFPEQPCAVFNAGIQLDVPDWFMKLLSPGKELGQITYRPSAHTVGAAGEVALLKWKHCCIAVWNGNTGTKMKCQ